MPTAEELQERSDSGGAATFEAVLAELRSTRETAQGIAHDGPAPDADVSRLLAGLLAHLAEQVERVVSLLPKGTPIGDRPVPERRAVGGTTPPQEDDDATEEDISPEDAPAEPARDPDAQGDR